MFITGPERKISDQYFNNVEKAKMLQPMEPMRYKGMVYIITREKAVVMWVHSSQLVKPRSRLRGLESESRTISL